MIFFLGLCSTDCVGEGRKEALVARAQFNYAGDHHVGGELRVPRLDIAI